MNEQLKRDAYWWSKRWNQYFTENIDRNPESTLKTIATNCKISNDEKVFIDKFHKITELSSKFSENVIKKLYRAIVVSDQVEDLKEVEEFINKFNQNKDKENKSEYMENLLEDFIYDKKNQRKKYKYAVDDFEKYKDDLKSLIDLAWDGYNYELIDEYRETAIENGVLVENDLYDENGEYLGSTIGINYDADTDALIEFYEEAFYETNKTYNVWYIENGSLEHKGFEVNRYNEYCEFEDELIEIQEISTYENKLNNEKADYFAVEENFDEKKKNDFKVKTHTSKQDKKVIKNKNKKHQKEKEQEMELI